MKKVLFATTALVATAGVASAEVALSGFAEMGIYDDGVAGGADAQFHNDIGITFTFSGETDSGLTFGAKFDIDDANGANNINGTPGMDSESVFVSGGFGTVTLGETDGAFDWAMSEVNVVGGSLADDETAHDGFNGNAGLDGSNDDQILRYDYSFGAFGVAASLEMDDGTNPAAPASPTDDIWGIGLTYDADMGGIALGFGLGYQDGGTTYGDATGVSVDAAFGNGFKAGMNYSEMSGGANPGSHWGVGVGYETGAIGVGVNYGEYDYDAGATLADADGFGLAATYDLGGGASMKFGYGSGSTGAAASVDTWSLGVAMSF